MTTATTTTPPSDEKKLTKVTVNLVPRAVDALNAAAEQTGDSRTDTVNRALQMYALLVRDTADGAEVWLAGLRAVIDYDALAAQGLRLLGDYCDGPHGGGANYGGVFRVPGDPIVAWYCKGCFVDRWKALGCPELPKSSEARL